jgi:DNA processing protein
VVAHLRGLAPLALLLLAHQHGTASAVLEAVRAGRAGSEHDRRFAADADPRALGRQVGRAGARFVLAGDAEYPVVLSDLTDPPLGIFVRGEALASPVADGRADRGTARVGIVGARNCSPYGKEIAAAIGRGLGVAAVTVVSGAARGIDAAAHRGCLDGGGITVAILGSGIDVAYPLRHARLIEEIARTGSVVSEYPPGTPAEPFRFPARNRIVAALSRAVVVVEGAAGSGSMITVDHAQDCGRDVYAVPGPVTSPLAEVPLALIRQGAPMVRSAEDVLDELGLDPRGVGGSTGSNHRGVERSSGGRVPLDPGAIALLERLGGVPRDVQTLAADAGMTVGQALGTLAKLEMLGLVRGSGGRFERTLLAR